MKICIFGADGRTGKEVVDAALAHGHQVVACVYSTQAKHTFPESVVVQVGDVMDYDVVRSAVACCDAVISVIGHIKGSDSLMQTKGITNIVRAMKETGIRRIISLTGTGVRFEGDHPSLLDIIGNIAIKLIDRERIIDGIRHADVLKESGLDWTVLRVLKLSQADTPATEYHLTEHGPAENLTSRKKVAQILVDLVASGEYIATAPVVSRR